MKSLILSLRPLNLILVFLTQIIFYFLLFQPLSEYNIELVLLPELIYLFSICTICITAAGYLSNDYFDFEGDLINDKAQKLKSRTSVLLSYYIILFVGLFLAIFIALKLNNIQLVWIYVVASVLLFIYSSHLKSSILIGNILVSSFISGVILIFLLAEHKALREFIAIDENSAGELLSIISFYAVFAFCVNMFREIVKDIQDIAGDKDSGMTNFPIKYGLGRANLLASFFLIILMISLFSLYYYSDIFEVGMNFLFLYFVILHVSIAYLIYRTLQFKSSHEFDFSNKMSKVIMFGGLLLIILIKWA